MTPLRDLFTKLFKKKENNEPWLAYYSKEERKIKFTEKTIYEYLKDNDILILLLFRVTCINMLFFYFYIVLY